MAKKRLLVLGNSYMDYSAKVRRAPERLETVVSNSEHSVCPGGFAIISSICAANLDIDVLVCTRLGDDENAEKLLACISKNEIDSRFVYLDKRKPTGVRSITVEDNYKARSIVFQGANNNITFDDIENAFITYPDALLINYDFRQELVADIIKFATSRSVPVIFSLGNEVIDYDIKALENIEILSLTAEQAARISGVTPIDATSSLHACVKITNIIKCKYVVIKLHDRGAFVFDGTYSKIVPLSQVEILDMTGTDIIFDAVLTATYLESCDVNKASIVATAAASYSATIDGVYNAIPNISDIKTILDNR